MEHRVLVIGGQSGFVDSIRNALAAPDLQLSIAPTLQAADTEDADVVVADVDEIDGGEVLRHFGDGPVPPATVLVTSDAARGSEFLRAGASFYVLRPIKPEDLRCTVDRAAGFRRLELEHKRIRSELEEKNRLLKNAEERSTQNAVLLEQRVEKGTQALLESELRYRELFNLANDAIFAIAADTGRILDANLQAEKITGYTLDELTSMDVSELHPKESQDEVGEFERNVAIVGPGCGFTGDLPFMTRQGQRIVMSVSCSIMELEGRKLVHRICRDVTELRQMEAELKRYTRELEQKFEEKKKLLLESQAQLVQAEKMAALGSLVAGIAHEINTPLASINSNNDIFSLTFQRVQEIVRRHVPAESLEPGGDLRDVLSKIDDAIRTNRMACERIVKIVRSLRNFARLDEAERKKVDIHEGIESTLTLVAHELKRRITVIKEFGAVREIECYPNQLNQVFMNILVNASQAIEGVGEIRIRTWEEENTVRISISDSGKGIAPEILPKIFDPGFTTKKAGLGTGLGLSICYRIIQDHNGRIDVESQVGCGTTFTIVLPIPETAKGK
jgi:PAS domain S-box-containing protein